MNRSIEKGLSSGERQMMARAKRILASEIQYAKDLDEAEALRPTSTSCSRRSRWSARLPRLARREVARHQPGEAGNDRPDGTAGIETMTIVIRMVFALLGALGAIQIAGHTEFPDSYHPSSSRYLVWARWCSAVQQPDG